VNLGESPAFVLAECGPPQRVYSAHVWSYEREGWFPRVLRFRGQRLISITAVSRFLN